MKKLLLVAIVLSLLIFLLYNLKSQEEVYQPIPLEKKNVTEELKYIFESDQRDREFIFDSTKKFKYSQIKNDSIRLSRVIELDTNNLIVLDIQKYYAAFIYHHSGGSKMKDDSTYKLRAFALCNEIINSNNNEIHADTISLIEFSKKLQNFQSLKNTFFQLTDVDTILKNNFDTLLIIRKSVKELAKGLKKLVESSYKNLFIENDIIHFDKLVEPDYQSKIKNIIRNNIKNSLKEQFPAYLNSLSDDDIEKLVNENFNLLYQTLINTKKGIIEDLQNNPENYKFDK